MTITSTTTEGIWAEFESAFAALFADAKSALLAVGTAVAPIAAETVVAEAAQVASGNEKNTGTTLAQGVQAAEGAAAEAAAGAIAADLGTTPAS